MTYTIYGDPVTKKNSARIVNAGKYPRVLPSKAYLQYRADAIAQITGAKRLHIASPVNLKVVYYMRTKRRVDLVNLLEATCDILVDAGVLDDDNSRIVVGHDGSRVEYDKQNPRAEITITPIAEQED